MSSPSVPAPAPPTIPLSTVTLPVTVPWSGLRAALPGLLPAPLAELDESVSALGGLVRLRVTGTVDRLAEPELRPDGEAVLISLPVMAQFKVQAHGLERDLQGKARVNVRVLPKLTPDWHVNLQLNADYGWLEPLQVGLALGRTVNLAPLLDGRIQAELHRALTRVQQRVAQSPQLRLEAQKVWEQLQEPVAFPIPDTSHTAFLHLRPVRVWISPLRLTADAVQLSVGGACSASVDLVKAVPEAILPLPALETGHSPPAVDLHVLLRLPYTEVASAAQQWAADHSWPLEIPTQPEVQLRQVQVEGQVDPRLDAQRRLLKVVAQVQLSSLKALSLPLTLELIGAPSLQGTRITWPYLTVKTRRDHAAAFLIGSVADQKLQQLVRERAEVDTAPLLGRVLASLQERLPAEPYPGVQFTGRVAGLRLEGLTVQPEALDIGAAASGELALAIDAQTLLPAFSQPQPGNTHG